MKVKCQFKSLDHSQALVEYIEDRFEKLRKFEIKPLQISVTVSANKHMKTVEVHVKGLTGGTMDATGKANDFYVAADKCLSKIMKQLNKEKQKVKKHKNFQRSSSGKLRAINAQLEVTDYSKVG